MLGCIGPMQLKDIANIFTKYSVSINITNPKSVSILWTYWKLSSTICGASMWIHPVTLRAFFFFNVEMLAIFAELVTESLRILIVCIKATPNQTYTCDWDCKCQVQIQCMWVRINNFLTKTPLYFEKLKCDLKDFNYWWVIWGQHCAWGKPDKRFG